MIKSINVTGHYCHGPTIRTNELTENGVSKLEVRYTCDVCGQRWNWTYELRTNGGHQGKGMPLSGPSNSWKRRMSALAMASAQDA